MTLLRLLALAAAALLIAALPARACSCLGHDSAAEQAASADLIFIGRVIDTGPERDPRGFWKRLDDWTKNRPPPHRQTLTTFQVDEALKGDPGRNITLRHSSGAQGGADCGLDFPRGEALLIIAFRDHDGGYATSLCSMPQFPPEAFREALAQR